MEENGLENKERKAEVFIKKLVIVLASLFLLFLIYKIFKRPVLNVWGTILNPLLDKPLPPMNFFKFVLYIFLVYWVSLGITTLTVYGVICLRAIKIDKEAEKEREEDKKEKEALSKVMGVVLARHIPKSLKRFWVLGLLYAILIIALGYNLSFFSGLYVAVLSYLVISFIYVWINATIDSFIVEIEDEGQTKEEYEREYEREYEEECQKLLNEKMKK